MKTPEEIEARFGQAVLGVVPLLGSKEGDIEKIVTKEPHNVVSENYKSIRTSILLSSADKPPQSILVTSMGPEEGKTVTSTNLAITIAHSDYSVLLVDGDLRKPRVHKIFGLDNTKVSSMAAEKLLAIPELTWLDLSRTPVDDRAMQYLKSLRRLEYLYLNDTQITDEGLMELKTLQELKRVECTGTRVSATGINALKAALSSRTLILWDENESEVGPKTREE